MRIFPARGLPVTVVIVISLGGLAMLAVGFVSLASFKIAERNTIELTRDKAGMILDAIQGRIQSHLEPVRTLVENLAETIAASRIDIGQQSDLETALLAAVMATPQVSVIAFVDPDMQGLRVLPNRPGKPAESRDWAGAPTLEKAIVQARSAQEPFWGELYFAERPGQAYLNLFMPVYQGPSFRGMLVVGISVQELSEFLTELGSDETGMFLNAFILYQRDWVLAHPALLAGAFPGLSDANPLPRITRIGDPVLHDMWSSETRREADARYLSNFQAHGIDLGEVGYVFIYREVKGYGEAPWTIGTYFQLEDLVSQAQRLDWIPIIAAAMLLVALVIAVFLGRGLSGPSRKLAAAAAKISNFDLEDTPVLELGAFREMNDAAAAFNSMVKGLKSFETYVPRGLVKELIAQHSGAEVPSEERELTVLFTDIVGFTAMAEELPASEVAAFLNEHFTLIGGCVDAEGGTIDKYIGDALMAFWGAPVWQDDPAPRACRAALAIRAAIEADNTRRGAAGLPPIRVRVGIHTGRVVVGNIGRPGRINYTVVGDTVNSSQRLESLGKEIDPAGEVTILISGATAAQLGSQFAVEPVGRFGVKGREKEIEVYSLKTSTASTEFRSKDSS